MIRMRFNKQLEGVVFNTDGVLQITVAMPRKRQVTCTIDSHPHGTDCLTDEEMDSLVKMYYRSDTAVDDLARTFRVARETVLKILQTAKSYRID